MRSTRNRGSLVFFLPSRLVQYRYLLRAGQPAVSVRLILIDSTDGPAAPDPGEELGEPAALTPHTVLMDRLRLSLWERGASAPPQTVISRAGWGADESYRFTATGIERWPRDYRVVQKVVVHHTDTSTGGNDPAAIVRAIYYYHAVTRGWDDIGYNFLIDWRGNIYEGRYGGRGVVGGHALGFNYGSLGIGCIGNYANSGEAVPTAMKQSIARLIAWKGQY
ncbi:MAG: N-acetylmuramoyl-L-alanine amidase, partial [Chloroflexi bacterium]|nr:N-acetylmuramoyl-L-alanine amidase [Chloroflexota bacterium]